MTQGYDCREAEDDFGQPRDIVREQKPPDQDSTGPDCWLLVLADMEQRRKDGIAKYGVPVRPNNGRDALVDLYQELLDACVYIRQEIEKRRVVSPTSSQETTAEPGNAAG